MSLIETVGIQQRNAELGAFLRSRRERLTPAELGMPDGRRRRTPGLRREEVALDAGVGTTWYTWLEQGRDVRPSTEVLAALARTLRLDGAESRLLFTLAGRMEPAAARPIAREISPAVLEMIASLPWPAQVLSARWDVLGWNRAAERVFLDYAALPEDERNVLHLVFLNATHRQQLMDWEAVARASLASFRLDSARHVGHPDFEALIAVLKAGSAEFRDWWPQQPVLRTAAGSKRLLHAELGPLSFHHANLTVDDGSEMRVIVYTPLAADGSEARLRRYLGG